MFGFGKQESSATLPAKFPMPIKRKRADGGVVEFNVQVSGFFFGSKGKPGSQSLLFPLTDFPT